jgi:glucose-6-phosphate isomerase
VVATLSAAPQTAERTAAAAGTPAAAETVYLHLEHLAANGLARRAGNGGPGQMKFFTL